MKNGLQKSGEWVRRNLRALRRAPKGVGIVAGLLWDLYVRKIDGEELKARPKKFYNDLAGLFGIKLVFNKASAPLEKDFPALFPANHISIADFIVMGASVDGTFAGKELPIPEKMLKAANYIGIKRVDKDHPDFKNFVKQSRGQFLKNLNDRINTIFFPEATAKDGSKIYLFRAAMFKGFYGENGIASDGSEVSLETEARVQPVSINVLDVEGKSVNMRPEMRHFYSHYGSDNWLTRIWTRLQTESITVELQAYPSMNPKDFSCAEDLANAANEYIRATLYPDQTVVEKAEIPGVAERGQKSKSEHKPKGLY